MDDYGTRRATHAFTVMSYSEWLQRTSEGALEKILQLCSKQAKPGYGYLGPKPSSCIRRVLETFNRCQEILVSPPVLFSFGRDLYHTECFRPYLTCLKEQNVFENRPESPRDFTVIPRFQENSITPLVCFCTKSTRILLRSKLSYFSKSITHRRAKPAPPFQSQGASLRTRKQPPSSVAPDPPQVL